MAITDIFKKKEEEKQNKVPVFKNVLQSPYFTEKSAMLEKNSKYVFKVYPGANKLEIKKAIESNYEVSVLSVKVINVKRKKRRLGRREGWRKGCKKAIVELKEGQKIDLLK